MKDITHYFQSPNKTSDSSNVFSEDEVQALQSPVLETQPIQHRNLLSSGKKKGKKSVHKRRDLVLDEGNTDREIENNNTNSSHRFVNGVNISEASKILTKASVQQKAGRKSVGEKSSRSKTPGRKRKNAEVPAEKSVNNGGSPNAFQVLMSTQQIFSSAPYTAKGKLEIVSCESEKGTEKKENKRKIKENLEKLVERKVKRKKLNDASENDGGPKKKRKKRRLIMTESDSESEEGKTKTISQKMFKPLEIITKTRKRSAVNNPAVRETSADCELDEKSERETKEKIIGRSLSVEESEKTEELEGTKRIMGTEENDTDQMKILKEKNSLNRMKTGDFEAEVHSLTSEKTEELKERENSCNGEKNEEHKATLISPEYLKEVTPSDDMEQDLSKSGIENSVDAKKRNSLFSYFNKVPVESKKRDSDTIKVTVDVHFPLKMEENSLKTVTSKKRKSKLKKYEEKEDEIRVVDSEVIEVEPLPENKIVKKNKTAKEKKIKKVNKIEEIKQITYEKETKKASEAKKVKQQSKKKENNQEELQIKDISRKKRKKVAGENAANPSGIIGSPEVKTPVSNKQKATPSSKDWKLRICVANGSQKGVKRRSVKLTSAKVSESSKEDCKENEMLEEVEVVDCKLQSSPKIDQRSNTLENLIKIPARGEEKKLKKNKLLADKKFAVPEEDCDELTDSDDYQIFLPRQKKPKVPKEISKEHKAKPDEVKPELQEAMIRSKWKKLMEGKADNKKHITVDVCEPNCISNDVNLIKECNGTSDSCRDENDKQRKKVVAERQKPQEQEQQDGLRRSKRTPKKMIEDLEEEISVVRNRIARRKQSSLELKVVQQVLKRAKAIQNKPADGKGISATASKVPRELAPVFLTKKKKRPDKAFLQAQKVFLNSGVPEPVKKMVDIIKLVEEQEHIVFPLVSHVQQKEDGLWWSLPDVIQELQKEGNDPIIACSSELNYGSLISVSEHPKREVFHKPDRPPKIKIFRSYLESIKRESPDFPVIRFFKALRTRVESPKVKVATKGRRRGRKRGSAGQKKDQEEAAPKAEAPSVQWTVKYKPESSEEIVVNRGSVKRLKKWLEMWSRVKEGARCQKTNEDDDASSGNEFINDGSDDEGSQRLPRNSVMLVGPPGSGKTMSVYAIAHELGYKVLEVNASSRRTGKRVLAELLEATQSHQVQGSEQQQGAGIQSFFAKKTPKKAVKPTPKKKKKIEEDEQQSNKSLILVEDVDIVFEDQDEGFISALSSLVTTSKRPVVLVTSDPSCLHLSRFLEKSIVLNFNPGPPKIMSTWMQLVCLLEGVRVTHSSIEKLFISCNNDIRRTLLHLQFWVLSGGENLPLLPVPAVPDNASGINGMEEASNSSWNSEEGKDSPCGNVVHPIHTDCLGMFIGTGPASFNLGKLWWNLPSLLGFAITERKLTDKHVEDIMDFSASEVNTKDVLSICENSSKDSKVEIAVEEKTEEWKWRSTCSGADMAAILGLYNNLSSLDVLASVFNSYDAEPVLQSWEKVPADSLSLSEDMQNRWIGAETTVRDISHWILVSGVSQCVSQLQPTNAAHTVGSAAEIIQRLPPRDEMSWREAQHSANNELWNAVPFLCWSEKQVVMTDYLPTLRSISRLEQARSLINSKRGNRFFHYLKGQGIHANTSSLDTLCKTFDLGIDR